MVLPRWFRIFMLKAAASEVVSTELKCVFQTVVNSRCPGHQYFNATEKMNHSHIVMLKNLLVSLNQSQRSASGVQLSLLKPMQQATKSI